MYDNYEVGYGKPPKNNRFRKGRSGNPRGRPKHTKTLMSELEAELREKITVREGDERKRVTKMRAIVKTLSSQAMKGNMKAVKELMALIEQLDPCPKGAANGERAIIKDDSAREKLIRRFDRLAAAQGEDKANGSDQ